MFKNRESEVQEFQEALIREISSSELGISISNANLIIIEEYTKMHPTSKRLDVNLAVEIREEIIAGGAIEIESEFVRVKNGKFKPLSISS